MSDETVKGSCLCGAVAYEYRGEPVRAHNCHCKRCRKIRGTPFAANLFVPVEAFRFTRGESEVRSYKLPEAARFTHAFCGICGSSLPVAFPSRGVAVIPMGSLDDDPGLTPERHIFVDSKAPWETITDALPQHPEAPPAR